jgi:hypothetical protein
LGKAVEVSEDFIDDLGGEAHRNFVEQYDTRVSDVGMGQGEHLLFPSAHGSGCLVEALAETRKRGGRLGDRFAVNPRRRLEPDVVTNAQASEHPSPLWHMTNTGARQTVRRPPGHIVTIQRQLATRGR